jgi:hypothetical protein
VGICKEYVIALRCELKRKELKEDDMARAAELAAYFTHCNLQVRGCVWVSVSVCTWGICSCAAVCAGRRL